MCADNNLSEKKLQTTDIDSKQKWFIRTHLLTVKQTQVLVLFSRFPFYSVMVSDSIKIRLF